MKRKNFKFVDSKGVKLNCYKWENETDDCPKAIVQISHGMSENILRYDFINLELQKKSRLICTIKWNLSQGHFKKNVL